MRYRTPRRCASLVECAIVFPVFLLFIIGTIVGSLGVFRYQEVASLAREGSRWASVRGDAYAKATEKPAATEKDVFENAIKPAAVGLDLSKLTYKVTWSPDNRQGSTVSVRVTYRWVPEAFLSGMDLSSTSTAVVSY